MDMEFRVTGDEECMAALRELVATADDASLIEAGRYAAEPIVTDAKGRAPSAVIAEGVQIVNAEAKPTGEVVIEVGLPGGRKPWFHGLFIEIGTGPRIQKTTGRRTGSMPADPFLRPAFDAQQDNARQRFFDFLWRKMQAVARG